MQTQVHERVSQKKCSLIVTIAIEWFNMLMISLSDSAWHEKNKPNPILQLWKSLYSRNVIFCKKKKGKIVDQGI